MKILWNKVTWYSQIIAIILFVSVFLFGMWLGEQKQKSSEASGSIQTSIVK